MGNCNYRTLCGFPVISTKNLSAHIFLQSSDNDVPNNNAMATRLTFQSGFSQLLPYWICFETVVWEFSNGALFHQVFPMTLYLSSISLLGTQGVVDRGSFRGHFKIHLHDPTPNISWSLKWSGKKWKQIKDKYIITRKMSDCQIASTLSSRLWLWMPVTNHFPAVYWHMMVDWTTSVTLSL